MQNRSSHQLRKSSPRLLVISGLVLAICLFYSFASAYRAPQTGINWNTNWTIIEVNSCLTDNIACEFNQSKLELGDRLLTIGDKTVEELNADRRVVPFLGYGPGEIVPLALDRDGNFVETEWQIPKRDNGKQIEFLSIPLLIYGPFWLIGSFVLIFLQPRDARWRLLVLFNYLTAIWIAIGLTSVSKIYYSSLFLHALSWILIPIFIHLHLLMPTPLVQRSQPILIPILYLFAAILAVAELIQVLPPSTYLLAIILTGLGSLTILGFRSFIMPPSGERLASRLMFTGVILAMGPGIILFIIPTLLGNGASQLAISLALLAIPILPLFYAYALYKHQLGIQEPRLNRLLTIYTLFLIYMTVFGVILLLAGRWIQFASELLVFTLVLTFALLLTALPFRRFVERAIDRLAYGVKYNKEEVVHYFASRIPVVSNRNELIKLLGKELFPTLNIRQSALLRIDRDETSLYFHYGIAPDQISITPDIVRDLSKSVNSYRPKPKSQDINNIKGYDWIRLVVPLQARANLSGLWLFGSRDPDDFYSKDDIDLLNTLAKQLAVTLENARLFVAFQKELANKEAAEQNLARYAERLRLLHVLDQSILAAESREEIGRVALEGIRQLVPCIRTSIVLFDPKNQNGEVLSIHGPSRKTTSAPYQIPITLFNSPIENLEDRIWTIDKLRQVVGKSSLIDELLSDNVNCVLIAYLNVTNKPIGTLNIAAAEEDAFSSEHMEIAREVANSVAIAINNARLRSIIAKHRQDLQQLSARLIRVQEDERKRISYELHDEIGQILTAVSFNLATIERECETHPSLDLTEKLEDTKMMVDQLTNQVRSLSLELRPTMLQDLGLVPTIRWYVNAFAKRRGIAVHLETIGMNDRFSESVETALYRVVQEALTNVSRHAEAGHVLLCIEHKNSMIKATIDDDGKGFRPENILSSTSGGEGVGLVAIRERVTALNGRFEINSSIGKGTHLEIEIPIGDSE